MHFLCIEEVYLHQVVVSERPIMRDVPELNESTDLLIFNLLELHFPFLLGNDIVKVPGLVVVVGY